MTAAVIKHDVNHLLIKNNGNATARQKPLKIFRTDKKQWENQKTRERIAATEGYWRLPSSPIVEKNILKMTAAVIKHDVNHLLMKSNGNATARQKPLKIFRIFLNLYVGKMLLHRSDGKMADR